ncbi:the RNA-binding Lupus La protein [Rhizoctonia solani]|uniref:The RNA-binding Lupus La protein n=1 Tax=Rhizoctonia solani TaxID=456999 RepID=A0A8H7IBE9_9AGAM|nr:the RNA-binding Lupus La protein [Rhizoctonia solani]
MCFQMDSQGWIPISTIASFNRLRKLTTDFNLVRDTMHMSSLVEISPDGEKARMSHGGWAQFVLPGAQSGDAQVGPSSAQGVPRKATGELGLGLVGVEQTQAEQPE